ncbi:unnamed protein product [Enterobius vermicularis]|uniref:PDZ domain-containing protein n=1 Tax=Enterobius vermicularis TaxID=51028 RepID=A0A0N4VD04_ENTVE|nr:unnamed protein product [Enterobius vermicularis]
MAYESLTVRMSRSSSSIPWGLTLRASGSDIVEKDSLADKAGVQPNDKVVEVAGIKVPQLTLNKANSLLLEPSAEFRFVLSRYITSHPSLPWNLTEKENKIVVDQVNPPKLTQYSYLPQSYNETVSSSKVRNTDSVFYKNFFTSESLQTDGKHEVKTSIPRPIALGYEPAPFKSPTSTSAIDDHVIQQRHNFQNEYNTSSYTKKETVAADTYKPVSFTTNLSTYNQKNANSGFGPYVSDSKSTEHHRKTEYQTQTNTTRSVPIQSNVSKVYTASFPAANRQQTFTHMEYQGPKTAFRHSPRTVRQLSPTASIKYLHSNPATASYVYETPAEEYLRKTGGLFGTDPNLSKTNQSPYLTSETRRLIAEEEGALNRPVSPAAQSSSFKRISRAVGTPVS